MSGSFQGNAIKAWEDSKEGIINIEHRKEGSRRGDREEECDGVVTTGRREQRLS